MISKFFINRPIFASVLSIVITLAGGIALFNLPIAQYPQIAPPTVQVDCKYPGASAMDVAQAVAAPIEQQVNGVENMMYMSSQCTNDGSYNLSVTFKHGVDLNMAQVLVQNRVALALPLLPDVIKQAGVTTRKRSPDILMSVAINSPSGEYDQLYLSNYAAMHVKDELARLPGISDVTMLGSQDYSMRVWVDPEKLASRNLSAGDVVMALREQNYPVATGQIGQPPVPEGQNIQVTLTTQGRLVDAEQFGEVILKSSPDGRLVRLKDVARVELGAKSLDVGTKVNGKPSASVAIFNLPDANALETADVVKAKMAEIAKEFPPGMQYEIRYDTTPFIRESIGEVVKTLQEAILLVAVVVLLFLQNWRSALIPLVAVPVAIVGTFAVMAALGFSLNNLTLFGLVLAIGIVVDDAIVVVESVEHHIEHGMAPRAATIQAMEEVSGPIIAIGLVLSAVFVPCAFISGIVGQFFRQFALTIVASTLISTINSLTLSPALAALLLKPKEEDAKSAVLPRLVIAGLFAFAGYELLAARLAPWLLRAGVPTTGRWENAPEVAAAVVAGLVGLLLAGPVNWVLAKFFGGFNAAFRRATGVYTRGVGLLLRGSLVVVLLYGGLLVLTVHDFNTTPTGFIPSQDMGYLLANVQLPDSASGERTQAVMDKLEKIAAETEGVKFTVAVKGQSLLLSAFGSNFGSMFLILDGFSHRPDPTSERFFRWADLPRRQGPGGKPTDPKAWFYEEDVRRWLHLPKAKSLSGDAIANLLRKKFEEQVPEAQITVLGPPPLRGVGRAGGFKLMVEDRSGDLLEPVKPGAGGAPGADPVLGKPPTKEQASGLALLQGQTENLTDQAKAVKGPDGKPRLVGMTSVFRANVPQLFVDVNRKECLVKRVAVRDLFSTLQVYLGSLYVNDFNRFGRTWQVVVQADQRFRNSIDDVRRLKVRNADGKMVPVGALAQIREVNGPLILTRYNMYTAAPVNGSAAPGVSSGEAITLMEQLSKRELLPSMAIEWTELAYLELQAGNTAMIVFGFAVVMVFLVLAAQYESWALPLAVILVVPMCLLSAISGVRTAGDDVNIFTQIGFVVLVGLASKNAILIVEFAKAKREEGLSRREATLEACRLRLRPIVMTSLAFILGVVPLLISKGAGAEMRRTLGTTVFCGMLGVTAFGIFLTPVFFYLIDALGSSRLFANRWARRVGGVLRGIFALGYVRTLIRVVRERRAAKPQPRPAVARPAVPPVPVPAEAEPELVEQK